MKKILENRHLEIVTTLFLLVTILIILRLYSNTPYSTDNSRYLLSALAQSQAAIIAIVVSLTLIAIQLSSQTYTPRVIDLFLRNKFFWFIFLSYIISIIYDLAVLNVLPPNDNPTVLVFGYVLNSSYLIASASIFALITFSLLTLYIKYSIKILKPENIVRGLIENLKPHKIEEYCKGTAKLDPFTPIRDICKRAIEINDEATLISCAKSLENLFKDVNKYVISKYPELKSNIDPYGETRESERVREKANLYLCIANQFRDLLSSICMQSCDKKLYSAVIELTEVLGKIGEVIASEGKQIGDTAINFVYTLKAIDERIEKEILELKKIFKIAPPPEVLSLMTCTIASLESICKGTVRQDLEFTRDVAIDLLEEIGVSASKEGPEFEDYFEPEKGPQRLSYAIGAIWGIKDTIVEFLPNLNEKRRRLEYGKKEYSLLVSFDKCIKSLEELGKIAVQKEWRDSAEYSVLAIIGKLKEIVDKKYIDIIKPINPTETIAESIKNVLTSSDNTTAYYLTKEALAMLEGMTKDFAKNGIPDVRYILQAITSIYDFICEKHCKGYPADMILGAPDFLGEVAEMLVEKKRFDIIEYAVNGLGNLGIKATKKGEGWKSVFENAMRWLILLGTLSLKNGNKELALKIAKKIKEMVESAEDVNLDKLLEDFEKRKVVGVYHLTNEDGLIVSRERKIDDTEFEFYKQFKGLII